jgi:peroxiredoxin
MLADGNGAFSKSLGLEMDATAFGMGLRSKRFALVAKDGIVTKLFVEAPGEFKVSAAEHVLDNL